MNAPRSKPDSTLRASCSARIVLGDSSKCKSAKVLLSGNMPFSCTFRNSSPNCSDGGTSDAQVASGAPAERALRAQHRTAIVVIKRARSSNGKSPRTMMSVFADDAGIEGSHVVSLSLCHRENDAVLQCKSYRSQADASATWRGTGGRVSQTKLAGERNLDLNQEFPRAFGRAPNRSGCDPLAASRLARRQSGPLCPPTAEVSLCGEGSWQPAVNFL